MKYEDITKVNADIKTLSIHGKEYAEVNERIIAFRKLFPMGAITTEIVKLENGLCVIKAFVHSESGELLATGHAYEKEGSSNINKTSYIENCETSAVGRALGMLALGIDTSVASYEEVATAIKQQTELEKITETNVDALMKKANEKSVDINTILKNYKVEDLHDLTLTQWTNAMRRLDATK